MPDPAPAPDPTPPPASASSPASALSPDSVSLSAAAPLSEQVAFRLAVFGAVLVVVLSTAFGVGQLVDLGGGAATTAAPRAHASHDPSTPVAVPGGSIEDRPHVHTAGGAVVVPPPGGTTASGAPGGAGPGGGAPIGGVSGGGAVAGGLSVTSAGLTLVPDETTFPAGRAQALRYRIVGAGNRAVTAFATVHDRPMHLILVRRDLSGYQHLHPTMAPDGTWSIALTLPTAGSWRAYADFTALIGGQPAAATLGVDLSVAGEYVPQPLPAAAAAIDVDGFTASWQGKLRVGVAEPLMVWVDRRGAPAMLEPYLGAFGHLVVLREGDLGYLHVHPEAQLVDGAVKFWLATPGPGRYRMFFDFQIANQVHTAAFTTTVS